MAIIRISDLAARKGVDPNSIPRHNGGDRGCMEQYITRGTDARLVEGGYGKRGAPVYESQELGDPRFFGSATVVTLKEQPPLPNELSPAARPRTPEEIMAMMRSGQKP